MQSNKGVVAQGLGIRGFDVFGYRNHKTPVTGAKVELEV